ncbi:MAG: bifunctional oligoribonuclease/PAP phosphatase NrnA [Calditrichaceae bacterium]
MNRKFEELHKLILKNERFVLTSHVYTDGDALGSLLALNQYLKSLNKTVDVIVPGEIPPKYDFLNTENIINRLDDTHTKIAIKNADVIIILDVSALDRLNHLYEPVHASKAYKVCLDHHPVKQDWIDLLLVDLEKVATGEIIYEFFKFCNTEISMSIAEALYTSILSDSGGFRFHRTGVSTFKMAADLVSAGIDPTDIYNRVFESGNLRQLKAWGQLLSNIRSNGRVTWAVADKNLLGVHGITLEEVDGIIDLLRKNDQADVVIVFIEKEINEILVGLRSKNGINVAEIAGKFGGGGHYHAAGFTSREPLSDVINLTLKYIPGVNIEN